MLNTASASKLNGVVWLSEFVFSKFDLDNNGGLDKHEFAIFYREEQNKSCMFEFPAFLLPTNLGLPMHSPSALKEHVSKYFFARPCTGRRM